MRKRRTRKASKRGGVRRKGPESAPPPVATPVEPAVVSPEKKMKTIWYIVGLVLLSMVAIICLAGIYYLMSPSPLRTATAHLYPDIWWGAVMMGVGGLFLFTNRKATVG